ncbi:MAG TPA: ribosome biogenesis factor YjgA [Candidatus Competibacteraceae bacterium]|nr:ribosome biogenesis factor YjgA [Candidatus Competibacteraceae bacterium]
MSDHDFEHQADWPEEARAPSRGQLKREAEALQALGERLVALKDSELTRLPLPEELAEAVHAARTITSFGARRRQLQYIGKLMRRIDAEPIRAALAALEASSAAAKRRLHRLEQLTAALLEDEARTLEALLAEHPAADVQRIRQLARNARKERDQGKPPAARRALFRYLRELIGGEIR